jgi:uncharacterized membrane protein (UPF0127 family)
MAQALELKPKLVNRTRGTEIASQVRVAETFFARTKGLLGASSMAPRSTLWIKRCNSIHTCFMRFAIDAVFVDRALKVKAVYRNLPPWRMTWPAWGANSVFELPAGTLKMTPIDVGDELYVGD